MKLKDVLKIQVATGLDATLPPGLDATLPHKQELLPVAAQAIIVKSTTHSDHPKSASSEQQRRCYNLLSSGCLYDACTWVGSLGRSMWKVVWDDPRRVVHSLKVGAALAIVSLLMLLEQTYSRIGKNAVWAVMTVVVVFEFTAGAALSKGLNRAIGTLVAGLLALGVSQVAEMAGGSAKPVIAGCAIFTVGASATFVRFFPKIKARYDYGVVIFLLTFCLIVVASCKRGDPVRTATDRLLIICLGCGVALTVSLFVVPIWAGDDLHSLIISNFYNLAESLEGCVKAYVEEDIQKKKTWSAKFAQEEVNDPICKAYRASLLSSQKEESLANSACWEPPHGRFGWRHPWKKYIQIGAALRHCAYSVMALHCCLRSDIQPPSELRELFQNEIYRVGIEASRVLRELGDSVKKMQRTLKKECMRQPITEAVKDLQKLLNAHASLLIDPIPRKSTTNQLPISNPNLQSAASVPNSLKNPTEDPPLSMAVVSDKPELFNISCSAELAAGGSEHAQYLKRSISMSKSQRTCSGLTMMEGARALSLATFTSLLIETASRMEHVVDAVEEFAELARFRKVVD